MLAHGGSLPVVTELIKALGKVSDLWLDAGNPKRIETIQALQVSTGLSPRQIEIALKNCFEEITEPKITAYIASLDQVQRTNRHILHVLPANAFTAWVHGAVLTLLLGHKTSLKPSHREPIFARAWKQSLQEIDSALSERVDITTWDAKNLPIYDAVVAYGSDETLRSLRAQLKPSVRFAGYGHKLSVAIVFPEAWEDSPSLLDRIRRDAEPFRLQGCLSPQILYVENHEFPLERELKAALDVAPKIKPFSTWTDVAADLAKFKPFLSCVGFAGSGERMDFLDRELQDHTGLRLCPLGEMQRPPLSWRNGGIDLLNLLNFEP
jgi:hypothetical protein